MDEKLILDPRLQQHLLITFNNQFAGQSSRWQQFCKQVAATPFLRGAGPRGWKASLNWCLLDTNLIRILNKQFENYGEASFQQSKFQKEESQVEIEALKQDLTNQIKAEFDIQAQAFKLNVLKTLGPHAYKHWFTEMGVLYESNLQQLTLCFPKQLHHDYCQNKFEPTLKHLAYAHFPDLQILQLKVGLPSEKAQKNNLDLPTSTFHQLKQGV